MDVRCPQCATTFEFDERQLRVQLVTLKCSVCQHMFRLEVRLPSIQESSRRWMVRQAATGDILYFGAFDTLHQWIMQQRIVADDAISRTGERWTRLAELGEFAPVFQVVESINALSRGRVESAPQAVPQLAPQLSPQLSPPGTPQAGVPQLPLRDRSGTMQQFSTAPGRPLQPSAPLPAPPPQPVSAPALPQPSPTGPQRVLPPRPRQPSAPLDPAPAQPTRQTGPTPAIPAQQAPPRTGPQRAVPAEDQWTIGDLSAPAFEQELPLPVAKPPSRALPIVVVLALLIIAGLAGAWQAGLLTSKPEAPATPDAPVADKPADAPAERPIAEAPDLAKSPDSAVADMPAPIDPAVAAGPSAEALKALDAAPGAVASAAKEAQSKAERAAKKSDPKALAKEARRALDKEQYSKARELFHQAIEEGEATPENVTGLGWALIGMGNAEAAVAQFNKALFINAGHEDAYIGLAKAERQRGRLREALKVYERHLARFPDGRKASISRYQRDQLKAQLGEE